MTKKDNSSPEIGPDLTPEELANQKPPERRTEYATHMTPEIGPDLTPEDLANQKPLERRTKYATHMTPEIGPDLTPEDLARQKPLERRTEYATHLTQGREISRKFKTERPKSSEDDEPDDKTRLGA